MLTHDIIREGTMSYTIEFLSPISANGHDSKDVRTYASIDEAVPAFVAHAFSVIYDDTATSQEVIAEGEHIRDLADEITNGAIEGGLSTTYTSPNGWQVTIRKD